MKPLNEQQNRAVTMQGNPLVVIAGPGSGKTETLSRRILQDQKIGLGAARQVAVTFTNNAGQELAERLERHGARRPRHVGTLHSWAFHELRKLRHFKDAKVIGDRAYEEIIREIIKKLGHKTSVAEARRVAMSTGGSAGNAKVLALAIRRVLQREQLIHPDLMLAYFAQELEEQAPEFGLRIYVDEFQDTAAIDAQIYDLLRERHGASLFVVGDRRQAIYGFRGASPTHLDRLIADADGVAELTVNYRSGPTICYLASNLAKRLDHFAPGAEMRVEPHDHRPIDAIGFKDYATAEEEAIQLCDWVAYCRARKDLKSLAILTRYNQGVGLIASVLRAHGIEVQASTDNEEDLQREINQIPGFLEWAIKQPPCNRVADWKGRLARAGASLKAQEHLAPLLARCDTPEAVVAILSQLEPVPDRGLVYVGTIHSAKGLEWDAVHLAGMDNLSFRTNADDICLAFVGVTRARKELIMSYARSRQSHKREVGLTPTPILPWTS